MPLMPADTPPPARIPQGAVSGFSITAPYDAGSPDAIYTGGDSDAGGRDDVSGTVAGAQAAAEARFGEHQSDTYSQGSRIGDAMDLPTVPPSGAGAGMTHNGGQ